MSKLNLSKRSNGAELVAVFNNNSNELYSSIDLLMNKRSFIQLANTSEVLNNVNYLGNKQNIHPKVLYFENAWNGYKYWMAYTPYPNGDTTKENPCIAVSNDLFNWIAPVGLVNPIDDQPINGYNSDTHIVYRQDINRLELWYRQYITTTGLLAINRRTSTDGVTWSGEEVIFNNLTQSTDIMSPAIIFEDGKYKIWYCTDKIQYIESVGDSVLSWTNPIILNVDFTGYRTWHIDVISTELGIEMAVQAYALDGGTNNTSDLFYVLQSEAAFTKPKLIIQRSTNPSSFDYKGIYRSSILKINEIYFIYYSGIAADNSRGMGLSAGRNIEELTGLKYIE